MRAFHSRKYGEKGVTMVESSLIIMVFLFLLIGVMECGRLLNSYHFLSNASREAVPLGHGPGCRQRAGG